MASATPDQLAPPVAIVTVHGAPVPETERLPRLFGTHTWRTHVQQATAVTAGPAPGRTVLSHPTYSAPRCSVEDAITDLRALGYDFHLFTHESGEDCLLRRTAGGYLLAAAHGRPPWVDHDLPIWTCDQSAPRLTGGQAQARLDLTSAAMLFYTDDGDSRGRLLYRRADSGYGLITPVLDLVLPSP